MFFELFLLLVVLVVVCLFIAFAKHAVWAALFAVVLMFGLGALLYSEGLSVQTGAHVIGSTGNYAITYDMNQLTPLNDKSVGVLAPTFFYGSFVLLLFTLGLLFYSRR
jgi:hypothetical protein